MKSFFQQTERSPNLYEELYHLVMHDLLPNQLQFLFNRYLDEKDSGLSTRNQQDFIHLLAQHLDKIEQGDLLYQAYKIIQPFKNPFHDLHPELIVKAANQGSIHAQHELAILFIQSPQIYVDKTSIVWALEYLRTALDNFYELPNSIYNYKDFVRDLLRLNTLFQFLLNNPSFFLDSLPAQSSEDYQRLVSNILSYHHSASPEYLINLPKPDKYSYENRLIALLSHHPIYFEDSFSHLVNEYFNQSLQVPTFEKLLVDYAHLIDDTDALNKIQELLSASIEDSENGVKHATNHNSNMV